VSTRTRMRAAAFAARCNLKFRPAGPQWATATVSRAGTGRRDGERVYAVEARGPRVTSGAASIGHYKTRHPSATANGARSAAGTCSRPPDHGSSGHLRAPASAVHFEPGAHVHYQQGVLPWRWAGPKFRDSQGDGRLGKSLCREDQPMELIVL